MLWVILRLLRGILRTPRRFKDPTVTIKKSCENRALGDPPVAAHRFNDPAASYKDSLRSIKQIEENRAPADPPVAARCFKDFAAF